MDSQKDSSPGLIPFKGASIFLHTLNKRINRKIVKIKIKDSFWRKYPLRNNLRISLIKKYYLHFSIRPLSIQLYERMWLNKRFLFVLSAFDPCLYNSTNECDSTNGFCINRNGDYNCECKPGFFGNGRSCQGKVPYKLILICFPYFYLYCWEIYLTETCISKLKFELSGDFQIVGFRLVCAPYMGTFFVSGVKSSYFEVFLQPKAFEILNIMSNRNEIEMTSELILLLL